jgi:hypothetical protein
MYINLNRICGSIVTVVFAISALACSGQAEAPSFRVKIALPNPTLRAGSPIRLDMTVQNETNQVLITNSIRFGGRQSGIVVRDHEGKAMSYKDDPAPDSIQKVTGASLGVGPGKCATESVNLSRYFDFRAPGQYSIQIVRIDPLTRLQVSSNLVTLTITP